MHNAFVFDMHGVIDVKLEESIDVTILFNGTIWNSLLNGVFILPIGNTTCPPTHVVVTSLSCGAILMFYTHIY